MLLGIKNLVSVMCLIILVFGSFSTFALSIAKVDVQKVLLSVKEGKRVRAQLKKMYDKRQKKLKSEEDGIRKMQTDFKKQSMVMNDKAKIKKEREIQQKAMRLQQTMMTYQKEIQDEEAKKKKPIMTKVKKIIDNVSKSGKYDMVFEFATAPVYIKNATDITDNVVKAYNKAHK